MSDDHALLRAYAADRSESAFAQLVSRHLDFVYATALRLVAGDTHLAQDVTQTVFIDLARKASSLLHQRSLEAWLYQATRFAAAKVVRTERRRAVREQKSVDEAVAMDLTSNPPASSSSSEDWDHIAPVLDDAIEQLATDHAYAEASAHARTAGQIYQPAVLGPRYLEFFERVLKP